MGSIYEMKKPKRINSFSVTLFIIVSSMVYLGYWYLPIWWPIFQMSGIMSGACNDSYHRFKNEDIVDKLLKDSVRTGLRLTRDNVEFVRVPYTEQELTQLRLDAHALDIYRKRGKKCVIRMKYQTTSHLPIIEKPVKHSFQREVETDLAVIKW